MVIGVVEDKMMDLLRRKKPLEERDKRALLTEKGTHTPCLARTPDPRAHT